MIRNAIWGVVFCVVAAGLTLAQEPQKPGTEHEELKYLVGEWDAVMDFAGQKSKCTAIYKSICDGMWVESDFRGNLGGVPFQGRGIDGYDQIKKKYVGIWVDSMGSAPLHMEGTFDEKAKRQTMTGETHGPDGKPQKYKTTVDMKDKDNFTFKMIMVGPDGKDQLAFTIEYTRRK